MDNDIQKFIDFIIYSEQLKTELRHASKSDSNRESAAEHSWRLALMVMLITPKLNKEIDLLKTLKMAIIHDLIEIEAEDVLVLDHIDNQERKDFKDNEEKKAIEKIKRMLGEDGQEIYQLWYEYLNSESYESKVLRVLNMIEGQMQFLSEDVKKFSMNEQKSVAKLIAKTTELSAIDPFVEELYKSCHQLFKERTKPI